MVAIPYVQTTFTDQWVNDYHKPMSQGWKNGDGGADRILNVGSSGDYMNDDLAVGKSSILYGCNENDPNKWVLVSSATNHEVWLYLC
jgi:hypothetical protein